MAKTESHLMKMDPRLAEHAYQWRRKPSLRKVYRDLYRRMVAACVVGPILEIGGGSGGFKEFQPDVVSSDILFAPTLDLISDAHRLPFANASFSNIVMFDVLHHLEAPRVFFAEASRVLRVGGRLVMVEPGITPVSRICYRYFHQEPVDMMADPFSLDIAARGRDAFDANQAIPTLLLRERKRLASEFPSFALRTAEWQSLFAYPLSGGFKDWSLLPQSLVEPLLHIEEWLRPMFGRLMAFRLLIVFERRSSAA